MIYYFTPLNNNIGIEFNSERLKTGIVPITENWKINIEKSHNYSDYWENSNSDSKHFKKVINLGIIGPNWESDYYHNPKFKGTFVTSVYNYSKKNFEYNYYIADNKVENKIKSVSLRELKPSDYYEITKSEFEKYLTD